MGTISRGGHTMFMLEWLHGLERLGHEVLFLDLVSSDFQERRERVSRAFDEVIQKWWHADLTSLMVGSTSRLALRARRRSDLPFRGGKRRAHYGSACPPLASLSP